MELEHALQELQYRVQQLELTNGSLQRQLEHITEEKEDREKEAVSWFNALEVSYIISLFVRYNEVQQININYQVIFI